MREKIIDWAPFGAMCISMLIMIHLHVTNLNKIKQLQSELESSQAAVCSQEQLNEEITARWRDHYGRCKFIEK